MITKKEDRLEKMRELMGAKKNINENKTFSNIVTITKCNDGNTYGLIKENNHYYIKTTNKIQESYNDDDFDYIGGLVNRVNSKYLYKSINEGVKNMNLIVMEINERLGKDIESKDDNFELNDDDFNIVDDEEDEPNFDDNDNSIKDVDLDGDGDIDHTNDSGSNSKDIDHYVGKLTSAIRDSDNSKLTGQKIKFVLNSVTSALPMENLNDEDRSDVIKRIEGGEGEVSEILTVNENVVENGNTFHKCHHILEAVMNGQKLVAKEYFDSLKNPEFLYTYMAELDFNETMINGYKEYFGSEITTKDSDDKTTVGDDINKELDLDENLGGTVELSDNGIDDTYIDLICHEIKIRKLIPDEKTEDIIKFPDFTITATPIENGSYDITINNGFEKVFNVSQRAYEKLFK